MRRDIQTVIGRDLDRQRIGRKADQRAGASRADVELARLEPRLEQTFGNGAAANIAGTDDDDAIEHALPAARHQPRTPSFKIYGTMTILRSEEQTSEIQSLMRNSYA